MPKPETSIKEVERIISLRRRGYTLSEILSLVHRSKSTIHKYIAGVKVDTEHQESFAIKRKGSVSRSIKDWDEAKIKASKLVNQIDKRDKLIILACLYWSEGNKAELNLINSDPTLIRTFVDGLYIIGVSKEFLRLSIRIYEDISKNKAIKFWCNSLNVSQHQIISVNVLNGKKKGKLKYGMCRVRVKKGGKYFKLIMSMIDLLRS